MKRVQSWRLALAGSILLVALTLGNIFGLALGDTPTIAILTPGVWLGHLLGIKLTLGEAVGLPMGIWAWSC